MREEQKELFHIMASFKRLNMSSILPHLSHGEFAVMRAIIMGKEELGGPVKVSYIIKKLKVHAPSVSRSLKSLEKNGCITRQVDQNDRRNTYVDVTEKGQILFDESKRGLAEFMGDVYAQMGSESMERLTTELKRLYKVTASEIEHRKVRDRKE